MFASLRERDSSLAGKIDAVVADHERIVRQGRRLLQLIRGIEEDALVERSDLINAGRSYFENLERHMLEEESVLFDAARTRLRPADWRSIESRIEQQTDPLFGEAGRREFERLWHRIEAHEHSA